VLKEENFDEFINWNSYAFICFYDSTSDKDGRMKRMLIELMMQVSQQSIKEELPHLMGIYDLS
jgi:hypothetical protein